MYNLWIDKRVKELEAEWQEYKRKRNEDKKRFEDS